jgi:uncharacterized protein (TIGR02246 family)
MTPMDEEIRARFGAFADAWNAHDVAAMVDCWTPTGNITHPWGTFAAGREAMTQLLAGEHAGPMRESRWKVANLQVRPLSDSTAVVQCDATLEGVRAPNDKAYDLPHRIDAVIARDGDAWRFVSMHPSFVHARG